MDTNLTAADFEVVKALRGVRNAKDAYLAAYHTGFRTPDGSPLGLYRVGLSKAIQKAEAHLSECVRAATEVKS